MGDMYRSMRLRNIPGAAQVVAESPFVINEPEKCRGRWREYFGNLHPIYIEVGMGKGRFLTEMAERSPEINYIGIERYTSVLLRAVEKAAPYAFPENLIALYCFGSSGAARRAAREIAPSGDRLKTGGMPLGYAPGRRVYRRESRIAVYAGKEEKAAAALGKLFGKPVAGTGVRREG